LHNHYARLILYNLSDAVKIIRHVWTSAKERVMT
jgi:hypothetical protein